MEEKNVNQGMKGKWLFLPKIQSKGDLKDIVKTNDRFKELIKKLS